MLEPVATALAGAECPAYERVGRAMRPGVSAGETWTGVAIAERRRGGLIDALTSEDRTALDGLFSQLGESGREQQDILLTGTISALNRSLEAAEARAREAEKLYLSLGVLVGLMLALIAL